MDHSITHYQTSFRVADDDGDALKRLKASVYGWVGFKEKDRIVKNDKAGFFSRCDWRNLFETHSSICTGSYFMEGGDGWALHYTEIDKDCGRKRYWYSDIGLKKDGDSVVVSVRISFAWNDEDLSHQQETPTPTVPKVIRFIIQDNHVYSGRREFRLVEKTISFKEPGMGKALCDFIRSPERRYPLIVFNGDGSSHVREAGKLARELTGKALVAVVASDVGIAKEMKEYLPTDYRIPFGQFRIFFPFNLRRNSPLRHRWYDVASPEYVEQRHGIINGLLRSHTLLEKGAIETIDDIYSLVSRSKLLKLEAANPEQQKQLNEFLEEHSKVAAERDQAKQDASFFAAEYDRLDEEVKKLDWRCKDYQSRLDVVGQSSNVEDVSKLLPSLPSNLVQVAEAAGRFFNRLVITKSALESAADYHNCQSLSEAWEMLRHLNDTLFALKFEDDSPKDLEKAFKERTGYGLALNEGKLTQKDKKLMRLRTLVHDGKEYDITPHLKHHNNEPKSVRIYFAFDEGTKKIIVGHIGRHIPNATTKTL